MTKFTENETAVLRKYMSRLTAEIVDVLQDFGVSPEVQLAVVGAILEQSKGFVCHPRPVLTLVK